MFSYISLEERVPQTHPLRKLRAVVDALLATMNREFDAVYARRGRPSVPPEMLQQAGQELHLQLAAQGVYLGEVVVAGFVQHTPGAEQHPHALNPDDIAQSFWDLHSARQAHSLIFGAANRSA